MKKNYERSNRKCCDPEGVIRRLVCNVLSWKSVIISRKRIRDMRLSRRRAFKSKRDTWTDRYMQRYTSLLSFANVLVDPVSIIISNFVRD